MATDDWDTPMREYDVVVTTRYRIEAHDIDDAIDRVSDGMGDVIDTDYRAVEAPA